VALLAIGPVGCTATAVGFLLVRRGTARLWVSGSGVLLATSAALAGPWPAGTAWSAGAQTAAAVVVSTGTGLVLGSLMAPWRSAAVIQPVDAHPEVHVD
jgi:hypothetical protein